MADWPGIPFQGDELTRILTADAQAIWERRKNRPYETSWDVSHQAQRQGGLWLRTARGFNAASMLRDFERIGDHAVYIMKTAEEIYEKKIVFFQARGLGRAAHDYAAIEEISTWR
jgi:phosphate uptake regulator